MSTKEIKEELRRLWNEGFRDSKEYIDLCVERFLPCAEVLSESWDGKVASVLLTMPYRFMFHGSEVGMSYLTGGATRRQQRGHGMMRSLVARALEAAADRGDMLCTLIPVHDWLYAYFEQLGFSSVFLADRQHFTSMHPFNVEGSYTPVEDVRSQAVYEAFSTMESATGGGVRHTRRDFDNVLDDLALRRDGTFVAVGREDASVAAMAWARDGGAGELVVNELLGVDDDARTAAMRRLRELFPERPMVLLARVDGTTHKRRYHSRGMGRIVNAELCLQCIARANPKWRSVIRVYDRMLECNNHVYVVENGNVTIDDDCPIRDIDLDVTVEVLAALAFSAPHIGEITGLPSERTHISLMVR